jgi:hypothetical protein
MGPFGTQQFSFWLIPHFVHHFVSHSGSFSGEIADKVMDKVTDKVQHVAKMRIAVWNVLAQAVSNHLTLAKRGRLRQVWRRV